jgi:xanthine dehydrogenase YagR molybdenum-binding subunit
MSESIGAPLSRLDGRAKVTGAATYAAEFGTRGLVHGVLVPAAIAHGHVTSVDTEAPQASPGVLRVFTAATFPRLDLSRASVPPLAQSFLPLQDDRVLYEGQPVALVVAETLEQAEAAAHRVEVRYERLEPAIFGRGDPRLPRPNGYVFETPERTIGNPEAGLSAAEVVVEGEYTLPSRHHNPMEPSATVAEWDNDALTLHTATQWTYGVRYALAPLLGLGPEKIHVLCPFTGGGFGCKGYVWPHQVIAAVAARELRRPLKLVLSRAQMYTESGYQPAMRNRVRLGARRDGALTLVRHETVSATSVFDDYIEFGTAGTAGLYATPNMALSARIEPAHVGTPTAMRAPHEGPGMFALETAMDELAYALGLDPLDVRLRNDTAIDPSSGKPYSTRKLAECYRMGAERFGWVGRPMSPGSLRDGRLLIGWGVASAIMTTFRLAAAARARLRADGAVVLEAGTQEIGTGTYTVFPQIAADMLGLDPAQIEMRLGDSSLPETGGTFGSSSTIGVGSAIRAAATNLRRRLVELARQQPQSPLHGLNVDDVRAEGGRLLAASVSSYGDTPVEILKRAGIEELTAEGEWSPGAPFDAAGHESEYAMRTFGAIFAEVAVDPDLGLVRLRRCVGVYNAGRIINPKTAASQMTGGMIWGYGQAVLEESTVEPTYGRYLSKNLSGVMLPVHADIPGLEVAFVDDYDPHASAIGARGIGELGAVGVSAAIGNAVFHATGIRVRNLPIRIERLLAA